MRLRGRTYASSVRTIPAARILVNIGKTGPVTAKRDVEDELLRGEEIRNVAKRAGWIRGRWQAPRRDVNGRGRGRLSY